MHVKRGNTAGPRLFLFVALAALAAGMTAGCIPARTITVTRTADDRDPGSLRQAIDQANTSSKQEVISLPAGTYTLTSCGTPEDANASGDLDIVTNLGIWIVGEGAGATIRQTCGDRVIDSLGSRWLSLVNVTITGGRTSDPGGGVRSRGPVQLDRAKVVDNETRGRDGVVGVPAGTGKGGGLSVAGDLVAVNSEISGNLAMGGAAGAACDPVGGYLYGGGASGGGAHVDGAVSLTQSLVADNRALSNFGEPTCSYLYGQAGNVAGGGVSGSSMTVDRSQVLRNHALAGPLGAKTSYIGHIAGGGISASKAARISDSTFGQNRAEASSYGYTYGSAAYSYEAMVVERSTFAGNNVFSAYVRGVPVEGGTVSSATSVSATNTTFAANTSTSTPGTPQVVTISSARIDLVHVTVEGDDGAFLLGFDDLTARATALHAKAGSSTVACSSFRGAIVSNGDNWSTESSCQLTGPTDVVAPGGNPVLGALADNGGPTATQLPQAGSPLIDKIPPARCSQTIDQRGVARPAGSGCDIGAVEVAG